MGAKTLTVYVGKDIETNFQHGIKQGIWGFKREPTGFDELKPGDFIVFGRGFSGNPRVQSSEWTQGTLGVLGIGRIADVPFEGSAPEWPDEVAVHQVVYPHRVRFGDYTQHSGPVTLDATSILPPDLVEGIRLSAMNSFNLVRDGAPLVAPPTSQPSPPPTPQVFVPTDVPATLKQMDQWMSSRGMILGPRVVQNLYAALRSKPFVLLAGNSGTGKSRVVRLFAEAAGATPTNGGFQMIPVRPDWNDGAELVGYYDLNGSFQPGRIVPLLLRAYRQPQRPFFVCLDEMNLARVEHYFSDFLSVVESRRRDGPRVVSDDLIGAKEVSAMGMGSLGVEESTALSELKNLQKGLGFPDNVFVFGTVNMDETTQPFSRKVLDRANTLEFNAVDFSKRPPGTPTTLAPLDLGAEFFRPDLVGMTALVEADESVFDEVSNRLTALNKVLSVGGFEVGYRVRDEAAAFVFFAELAGLARQDALDLVVLQKILPRLQGSSPRLEQVLRVLLEKHVKATGEGIGSAVDPSEESSLEENTNAQLASKLRGMLRSFTEESFTSFWLG